MTQYSITLDMTKVYEECFSLVQDALGQVEKEQEYVQFVKENAR